MDQQAFREAIGELAKEKNVSKEVIMDAIREGMITACKQSYKNSINIDVLMDYEDMSFRIVRVWDVVDEVFDESYEMDVKEARKIDPKYEVGDIVQKDIPEIEFGRIAASSAKNVMFQQIREEERKNICDEFKGLEKHIVTGVVQRFMGKLVIVNLGRADGQLTEREQVRSERLRPNDRIKVYILEVKDNKRGPKIYVSRTHPDLVRMLFEEEVSEVRDGTVQIMSIAREPGSRTKIAVYSDNPDVDPVGACVGMNGSRVNTIVDELRNEKIDIVNWDENPALLIENALSPAKVISVLADPDDRTALVIVPDYQLSLAIGKEGQNARLAAKLTNYKIDIKDETQAKDAPGFRYEDYMFDDDDEYDEDADYIEDGEYAEDAEYTDEAEYTQEAEDTDEAEYDETDAEPASAGTEDGEE